MSDTSKTEKQEYLVVWEIEVSASSPREAAEYAAEAQRRTAIFQVIGPESTTLVDLDDVDEEAESGSATTEVSI